MTTVVLSVISPLAWRIASSRPLRIWSATGSRFDFRSWHVRILSGQLIRCFNTWTSWR